MSRRLLSLVILSLVLVALTILGVYARSDSATRQAVDSEPDPTEVLYSQLKEHKMVRLPNLPITIYVEKVKGRKLVNLVLKRKNTYGEIDYVVHARSGQMEIISSRNQLYISIEQAMVSEMDGSPSYLGNKCFVFDLPKNFGQEWH